MVIEIRKGLRRLDFRPAEPGAQSARRVVVHFAVAEPLAAGAVVSINLGLHDGVNRVLQGVPRLLERESRRESKSHGDFVYSLEGEVP